MRPWPSCLLLTASLLLTGSALRGVEPGRFLPEGATIVDPDQHVVVADLDLDGKEEVVVFYVRNVKTDPKTTTLVLQCDGEECEPLWTEGNDEVGHRFLAETGVYTLQEGRRPQIVTFSLVGASCGGVFRVFEARSDSIVNVSGDWVECQRAVTFDDLDENGNVEIILDTKRPGTLPTIFEWQRDGFALASEKYPDFFTPIVESLVAEFEQPRQVYPVSAWLAMFETCLDALVLQKNSEAAIGLSKRFLGLLDEANRVQGSEREQDRARSTVHRRLADLYDQRAQEGAG